MTSWNVICFIVLIFFYINLKQFSSFTELNYDLSSVVPTHRSKEYKCSPKNKFKLECLFFCLLPFFGILVFATHHLGLTSKKATASYSYACGGGYLNHCKNLLTNKPTRPRCPTISDNQYCNLERGFVPGT